MQSLAGRASIDMIIDAEKISEEFIKDFIYPEKDTENIDIQYMSLYDKETNKKLEYLMQNNNYDSIILLVSDYYIGNLGNLVRRVLPTANLAVSNNFHICCGEGLCGSCSVDTSNGGSIKMCKCQLKGEELVKNLYQNTIIE